MAGPVTTLALLVLLVAPLASALAPPLPLAMDPSSPAQAQAQAPAQAQALSSGPYSLGFRCPGAAATVAVPTPTCPTYVLDREDIMAQPILLADPHVANLTAFSALHGGKGVHAAPGDETPTERSRDNVVHQTHTTFRSTDGGSTWNDEPYHAPDSMNKSGRQVFGEDNAATLDGDGRLYLANAYSFRDRTSSFSLASGPVQYAVGVWKGHRLDRAVQYESNVKVLPANGTVDSIFLTHDQATDTVVLVWRETPQGGVPFAQVYSTKPKDGALWTKHDAPLASACADITNPLASGGRIFLGCRSSNGTSWAIFALDPKTWTSTHVDDVGVGGQHGLLLARGDAGMMILVASGLAQDGRSATVQLAYGENGARWSDGDDLASKLTQAAGQPLGDARVTAAAFVPQSANVHLVYAERVDAARTGSTNADRPEFTKVLAAVQAEGSFQGLIDLQVGRISRADFSPTLTGVGNGAYADLHDSIAFSSDGKELLAYGDYGFVRYAQVVETDFLPPISPLGAQAPAIPLASGGVSPALYGVPAGLLSGAMVARTLMARRKQAVEAPSE